MKYKCETCYDTGYYGDNGPGIKGNKEYQPCDVCKPPRKNQLITDTERLDFLIQFFRIEDAGEQLGFFHAVPRAQFDNKLFISKTFVNTWHETLRDVIDRALIKEHDAIAKAKGNKTMKCPKNPDYAGVLELTEDERKMLDEVNAHPEKTIVSKEQVELFFKNIKACKKPFIKITRVGAEIGGYIVPLLELSSFLDDEFSGVTEGDKITLEVVYMTDEEYAKLSEFEGW